MKKYLLAFCATALFFGSCKKETKSDPPVVTPTDSLVTLTGDISANKTLDASKKYLLKGFVYVTKGATLTIPAGTVIMGDKASKGTLVITRGAKIDAQGTSAKPVVFTSAQASGARREGDWGGVIILGNAPINPSGGTAKIEGGLTPTTGGTETDYIWYGGTDASDNSGTMKYCRIEFAGIAYSPDNEINGLTLGGVGSGTKLSYIQVYRSGDDAFEWFGGTVNADHLVASYSWDDDWDTDFGFSGNVQFCVSQRVKTIADQSGSNGFESDNDGNGSTNLPQTRAVFSNMTVLGPITSGSSGSYNANFQHGAQIRRNSALSVRNSIIVGFPLAGVYIDGSKGTPTHKNLGSGADGQLSFKNNIIAGCPVPFKVNLGSSATAADSAIWNTFKSQASIRVITKAEDVLLVDANKFSSSVATPAGRPNFLLAAGSPAATGSDYSGMPSFFTNVPYVGAFDGSNDWTAGWTNWEAETTNY
jgi:hypothetical protein